MVSDFKYLIPVVMMLFGGCRQNIDFLGQFQDRGETALECVKELKEYSAIRMTSMLKSGEYIVWSKYYTGKAPVLYVYNLESDRLAEFSMPLKDSVHSYYPERLYACNDSVIMSFNEMYQHFSYTHIKDSFYTSGYRDLEINNEEFFDWRGRAVMRFVYPGEDSLYFVGGIGTKNVDYGVYEGHSRFLFPSYSCIPPTVLEMKCLLPDYKDHIAVVKQKGNNRYAVFRRYYQLYDVIDMRGTTLQLVKRKICHHSLLTWKDQYNLQQDLSNRFFPGFFVESSRYIIALYQSCEKVKRQYVLVSDWEGKPLYSYRFPIEFEVYGLCGDEDHTFYVAGRMKRGKAGIFRIKC